MNMRKIGLMVLAGLLLLSSCKMQPNPLTGTWADNAGSTLTLMADNTFLAKIINIYDQPVTTEGTYSVLLNAITFTTASGHQRVSEWDIRGNILYLNWTDDTGVSMPLSLYKVRN